MGGSLDSGDRIWVGLARVLLVFNTLASLVAAPLTAFTFMYWAGGAKYSHRSPIGAYVVGSTWTLYLLGMAMASLVAAVGLEKRGWIYWLAVVAFALMILSPMLPLGVVGLFCLLHPRRFEALRDAGSERAQGVWPPR